MLESVVRNQQRIFHSRLEFHRFSPLRYFPLQPLTAGVTGCRSFFRVALFDFQLTTQSARHIRHLVESEIFSHASPPFPHKFSGKCAPLARLERRASCISPWRLSPLIAGKGSSLFTAIRDEIFSVSHALSPRKMP